jgi:hypothetical protein
MRRTDLTSTLNIKEQSLLMAGGGGAGRKIFGVATKMY